MCSNVPGYQEPKCFVFEGDPDQLLEAFDKYLTKISTKSSFLLRQHFAPVFEVLKQKTVPNQETTKEDQLAQLLVDLQEETGSVESGGETEEQSKSES